MGQLTSSTGTVSTPHSPNSPLAPATVSPGPQFTVSPGPRAAVYSDVNRNGETSGNGITPTVIYSETTESRVWYCHFRHTKQNCVKCVCVCVCFAEDGDGVPGCTWSSHISPSHYS